ncbi:hypothetical protein ABGB09_17360 [Streptomyces sp. B8F3]|uniref:hypothetical protein n=1 Tax=Streptomyces sp. B8F3 TaxID=3153573 RepID=UPI00325DB3D6
MTPFVPAVERPWRGGWPAVARGGDGNAWVPGVCWLFCRREGVAVLWVGSVVTPGAGGEMYACGACIAELDHMVRMQAHGRDRRGHRAARYATLTLPAHQPAEPRHLAAVRPAAGGCEHPRTERRDGKTYCHDCGRQLYL